MTCLRSRVPRKAASPASTPRPGRRLAAGRGHVLRPPRFLLSSLQKSLKSPPYAHTSAEHGSDRSKFKGRCGGGSSDGIRGQATPANPDFLGRHARGSADDAGCFDRTPRRSADSIWRGRGAPETTFWLSATRRDGVNAL